VRLRIVPMRCMEIIRKRCTVGLLAALLLGAVPGAPASAHTLTPEQVEQLIASPQAAQRFGVVAATPHGALPRLLIVRVGAAWQHADEKARLAVAEEWWQVWRHSVAQGIVAVVEDGSGRSLINFDPSGRARLAADRSPTPAQ
jgi:hypothetical protein